MHVCVVCFFGGGHCTFLKLKFTRSTERCVVVHISFSVNMRGESEFNVSLACHSLCQPAEKGREEGEKFALQRDPQMPRSRGGLFKRDGEM